MRPNCTINYDDFEKVDIRVGTVIRAEEFPEARIPAFKLWLDFGPEFGELKTSAQVTKNYNPSSLVGKQLAAVINFSPKQVGPFMSDCLVLGFPDRSGEVTLITTDQKVPNGGKLF